MNIASCQSWMPIRPMATIASSWHMNAWQNHDRYRMMYHSWYHSSVLKFRAEKVITFTKKENVSYSFQNMEEYDLYF